MSHQTLRRRTPLGAGLEADLAAVQKAGSNSAPLQITPPPEDVSIENETQLKHAV